MHTHTHTQAQYTHVWPTWGNFGHFKMCFRLMQQKKYVSHGNSYNFWTMYHGEVVNPLFCCYEIVLYNKIISYVPICTNFADVSTFSAHFEQKIEKTSHDVTWRHVTQCWQNFGKMFLFIVSYFCKKLKLIASFLPKLWKFFHFYTPQMPGNDITDTFFTLLKHLEMI